MMLNFALELLLGIALFILHLFQISLLGRCYISTDFYNIDYFTEFIKNVKGIYFWVSIFLIIPWLVDNIIIYGIFYLSNLTLYKQTLLNIIIVCIIPTIAILCISIYDFVKYQSEYGESGFDSKSIGLYLVKDNLKRELLRSFWYLSSEITSFYLLKIF